MNNKKYKISIVGCGNVAYRLSLALSAAGMELMYIMGRDLQEASKLVYILNKAENRASHLNNDTQLTSHPSDLFKSDIIILAVNDSSILEVSDLLYVHSGSDINNVTLLHCSGACDSSVLNKFTNYGVLYPLMTLSKTKPVDFGIIPFFLESSNIKVREELTGLCYALKSEYRFTNSEERLKLHLAAVYVSNFINYLTGMAFDLSKPNQMFLMPLAIETIRKAFLYEHPSLVQTGPAIRGDSDTINKHLSLLENMPLHKDVYEMLTSQIKNIHKKNG
jgi:predicted short-subunit dehydrogenase-like oxidoreductase (DUF2520 family)